MEYDSGICLEETCGTRDESPSSNLGRGKQGEAILADVMRPQVAAVARDEEWSVVHHLQTPQGTSPYMPCSGPWEARNRSSGEE